MSTFDPEAEQEVDFGRYWRLLAARWWVPVAGLVVGAVVGYLIALGGNQVYKATATLYLGQPYTASGNVQLSYSAAKVLKFQAQGLQRVRLDVVSTTPQPTTLALLQPLVLSR